MAEGSSQTWINEWLALMADVTISTSKIEAAHKLKDANLPSKVYKFRKVDKFAIDNFRNDTVWLCSASSYNDPYDCVSTFSSKELSNLQMLSTFDKLAEQANLKKFLIEDELRQIRDSPEPLGELVNLMLLKMPQLPPDSYDEVKAAFLHDIYKKFDDYLESHFAFTQNGTKICSFSARLDSVVMWGHYAASQTGFCLEYDVSSWPPNHRFRRRLFPVIYSEQIFDITKYLSQAATSSNFNLLGSDSPPLAA